MVSNLGRIKIWESRQECSKNGFPSIYKALREFEGIYKGYKFLNYLAES